MNDENEKAEKKRLMRRSTQAQAHKAQSTHTMLNFNCDSFRILNTIYYLDILYLVALQLKVATSDIVAIVHTVFVRTN